jgi:hypothetical protein
VRSSHCRILGVLTAASLLAGGSAWAADLKADLSLSTSGIQQNTDLGNVVGGNTYTVTDNLYFQGGPDSVHTVTFGDDSANRPSWVTAVTGGTVTRASGVGQSSSAASTITVKAPCATGAFGANGADKVAGASVQFAVTAADGAGPSSVGVSSAWVNVKGNVTSIGSNCASNHAPTTPGAPYLSAGVTPNKTGQFTLSWDASTDSDAGDSVTYVLEHKDADDAAYSVVASGLTANSYAFSAGSPEPEGTWTYRVKAYDGEAYSGYSPVSGPVKVDKTAPNAPVISTNPSSPAYVDGTQLWFKDSVTVSAAGNGDPELQDTSAGSGVDSSTLTAQATYSTEGAHTFDTTVKDFATNESVSASLTVNVDPAKPTVAIACPTGVILGAPASASWTASDPTPGSGLATPDSGSISGLDTSTVGSHTATAPAGTARDNVGHDSDAVSCTYTVSYRFLGFFQPINDPAGADYSTFKLGSTVPVKFALADYNGNRISDAAAQAIADACDARFSYAVYSSSTPAPVDETASSNPANTGDCFRYDPAADQFIFNWGTKGRSAMQYTIKARVFSGDAEVAYHDVRVGLR